MIPFKLGEKVKAYGHDQTITGVVVAHLKAKFVEVAEDFTGTHFYFHYKQCRRVRKSPTLGRTWYIPKEWVGTKNWKNCFEMPDGPFIKSEKPSDVSNYMVIREVVE